MAPVSLMSRVASQVRMLQFQFSKFRLGADYIKTFEQTLLTTTRAHLHELFKELLAPAWSQLRGRRLVIVPHGALHYVPFHALFDGEQYVTDACAVSYAPSGSIYARCQQQKSGGGSGALVLGVADEQAPLIDAEARAVAAVLPECATVHRPRCDRAGAAHVGPGQPHRPYRLARLFPSREPDVLGHPSRGHLSQRVRPVSTAAARGPGHAERLRDGANVAAAGDELLGITRGLFCAGAHTLLLSLWNVHDESTAELMTRLYRRIAAGAPPVDALRDTMRDLRSEHPHPYYWAPFVLTGKSAQA